MKKYCGDVLMQKTFTQDCINKKVIKNTGQLPMYLIQNNHPAIVSREIYQAVQAEKTRRSASASPSKRTSSTGRSCYASKFALSERDWCAGSAAPCIEGVHGSGTERQESSGAVSAGWTICSVISMGKCFLKMPCVLPLPTIIALAGWGRQAFTCFVIHLPVNIWVDCGGDAFMLQKLLGHSTLAMTKHYCAIYDADISKNYDRFSPWRNYSKPKASSGERDRA